MNEQYFYQDRGKTIGPIQIDDVKERIKDGRIKLFDLVYRDGEEAWRMALEHQALRAEFKSSTIASMKDRPWVCLQRKSQSELEFYTAGPFTQEEVHESLLSGRVSYSDYAWKDGFQDWKRIGSLEEFNPRVRSSLAATMQPVPEVSAKELLKNVVEFKRPLPPIPEPPPPEAKTSDLTKGDGPPPVPGAGGRERRSTVRQATPPEPSPVVEPKAAPKKKRSARLAVDWGLVGVLVLVLAGAVVLVSRFALVKNGSGAGSNILPALETDSPGEAINSAKPKPVNENEPIAGPPAADAEADAAGSQANSSDATMEEPAEPLLPAKPESKMPGELSLAVRMVSSNQARIEIRTDGSAEYPVYVQIVGYAGQVGDGGAFYRYMRYIPSGNPRQALDLSSLKLPQGKFVLRAETGTLKRETKFSLGLNDPIYKRAVLKQRKMWAHAIWRERLTLFHLSQLLERQIAQGMVPTKKFSAKGLDALLVVKRANGAKYFIFEEWWELHQVAKAAKDGSTPVLLARAQRVRDRLATFSVWK